MKKRILLISFSNQYIFQETTILMQNYYKSAEYEIFSITSSKQIFTTFEKTENNIFVECPTKPGFSFGALNSINFRTVVNIVTNIDPTDILFYSSHTWNLKLIKKLKGDISITHVIHDVVPHDNLIKNFLISIYNKRISKKTNKIIVHSRKYLDICIKKFSLKPSEVYYLPILRRFVSPTPLNYTGNFIFMGRISKYKGIVNLVKIVNNCKDQMFLVVGKFSRNVKKYKKILEPLKNVFIDDNYVSENKMKNYIINSDWFILPYKSASQSGVIPDAYVHSRPVITFDVGNLSEQISKDTGFLIEKDDILAFIEQVKKCSKMVKIDHDRFCESAYNFGVKQYSFEENKENFYLLFE